MSIAAVKQGLVAAAICLLTATALPLQAAADCCVCTGCEGTARLCSTVGGCDFEGCADNCEAAGCSRNLLRQGACSDVPICQTPLGVPVGGPAMMLSMILVLATLAAFALRRRSLPTSIRAASLAAVIIASAAAIDALTQIQLSGEWQSDAAAVAPGDVGPKQWKADLVVGTDGTLSGTVELTGFGDVSVANVEGTLVDGSTSGTLRTSDGTVVAQFQGNGDAHAVHGTFTKTPNGETGTFSWSSDS